MENYLIIGIDDAHSSICEVRGGKGNMLIARYLYKVAEIDGVDINYRHSLFDRVNRMERDYTVELL